MRHSLGTILAASGESLKTTQGLLTAPPDRHTANLYTRDDEAAKRTAQGKMRGLYIVKAAS
jgi:hypothetical protein